jgi:hypothetical protein
LPQRWAIEEIWSTPFVATKEFLVVIVMTIKKISIAFPYGD